MIMEYFSCWSPCVTSIFRLQLQLAAKASERYFVYIAIFTLTL